MTKVYATTADAVAAIDVTDNVLALRECAPGVTEEQVRAATGVPLTTTASLSSRI